MEICWNIESELMFYTGVGVGKRSWCQHKTEDSDTGKLLELGSLDSPRRTRRMRSSRPESRATDSWQVGGRKCKDN